ncbi:hypothetical protein SAMN03159496_06009 [Rhizobium sp. NFR07]|nr:hypothetical protein SAMN03159496_06009 [Rhizobium sp. NFR07]
MKSENKPGNRIAAVRAILVVVVAGLSAYMVSLSPVGAAPTANPLRMRLISRIEYLPIAVPHQPRNSPSLLSAGL